MKLKLSVGERFTLIGILPQKADYAGLKELRKLREKLSLTDDEVNEFEFKTEGQMSKWNSEKDREVEIRIGEIVAEMVKKVLKDLNSKKELTERQVTLFEKMGLIK